MAADLMKIKRWKELCLLLILSMVLYGCAYAPTAAAVPDGADAQAEEETKEEAAPEEGSEAAEEPAEESAEEAEGKAEEESTEEAAEKPAEEKTEEKTEEAAEAEEGAVEEAEEESTEEAVEKTEEASVDTAGLKPDEALTEEATEASSEDSTRKRRRLPDEVEVEEKEVPKVDGQVTSKETVEIPYPASLEEVVKADEITGHSVMFAEKKGTKDAVSTVMKDSSYPDSEQDVENILANLAAYWEEYNLEAVEYLVRMDKYRYMSGLLDGSKDYFYYGDENENGEPHGKGVAVYADNAYYYGEFENGLRSGTGYWYQTFLRGGIYSVENNGILGHSYNGEWLNDLPDGEGQEHLDLDFKYVQSRIITNVIGHFTGGYYNGEEICVSVDPSGEQINWKGKAVFGTWVPVDVQNVNNEWPVLRDVDNAYNCFWMKDGENHGQGITGLIP